MVVFKDVSKCYGNREVLSSVSFNIEARSVCGIMGKNGAGKSTLLNIIHGQQDYQGEVSICNQSPKDYKKNHFERLFFLDDNPHIYDYLTPLEYVQFCLETKGIHFYQKEQLLSDLIHILDLKSAEKSLIKNFSFGMRRKVKLLAVLLSEPQLLLMDEPTLGLDAPSVVVFKRLVVEFAKQGTTIIVASHEPDFLKSICSHILILHDKKIVYDNSNVQGESVDLNKLYLNILDLQMDDKINALFQSSR